MSEIVVLVTCPQDGTADTLAETLVNSRLAACVNVISGVKSIYRWKDGVEKDSEALLIIKTTSDVWTQLENKIHEEHPYEVPEIVSVPIERGCEKYLGWLNECVVKKEQVNS
ncbi:MAG: divalent-cation tolerance protein CutA [Cyanobacteria bacterium TGS_CYA1]|nr:divalent-cation tolerance protein CutA [Cyanobacteria bacterium TGS_CYA1]